jgi:ankyrin repeat protein
MISAYFGHVEVTRLLLDKGANIEAQGNDGSTALMEAVSFCHTEAARLLLDKGADVFTTDNDGKTPLEIAMGQEGRDNREIERRNQIVDLLKASITAREGEFNEDKDESTEKQHAPLSDKIKGRKNLSRKS